MTSYHNKLFSTEIKNSVRSCSHQSNIYEDDKASTSRTVCRHTPNWLTCFTKSQTDSNIS